MAKERFRASTRLAHADEVAAFLLTALGLGAVPVGTLEHTARAAGLLGMDQGITNAKLFRRAKRALQVRSIRGGFGHDGVWSWELPSSAAEQLSVRPSDTARDSKDHSCTQQSHRSKAVALVNAERSSIEAPDRHIPREWIRGVALLNRQKRPLGVPQARWQLFVADCAKFLGADAIWAERAAELGWDAVELFGCHPDQPLAYLGDAGLLWFVTGGELVRLHQHSAVVAIHGVQHVVHRRPNSNNVTLPWQLRMR
jgi:hypothetical protein